MAETNVLSVPSGMLRISKEGETDRIIYPVHAEGWRSIGWTRSCCWRGWRRPWLRTAMSCCPRTNALSCMHR